jgi:hypothetical protein
MRRSLLVPALLLWTACGSGPGNPTPSPSPTAPPAGGPITGRYRVEVTPSASCAMPRGMLSFPVQGGPGGTSPHPGVQVLLVGDGSQFELELLTTEVALRGGVGTVNDGVICNEGLRVYIHAIGAGPVFRSADGRGQILNGTLSGYIALAEPGGAEGDSGTCTASDHLFVLRAQ